MDESVSTPFVSEFEVALGPVVEPMGFVLHAAGVVYRGEFVAFRRKNDWVIFYLGDGVACDTEVILQDRAGQVWSASIDRMVLEDESVASRYRWGDIALLRWLVRDGISEWIGILERQDHGCLAPNAVRMSDKERRSILRVRAGVAKEDMELVDY